MLADDSTIVVRDDESLLEIHKIVAKFEDAMGSKLNKQKYLVLGIGKIEVSGH